MKRPDTIVQFTYSPSTPISIAHAFTEFVLNSLDGHLYYYFAHLEFDEEEGQYGVSWEDLDVRGSEDLFRRVRVVEGQAAGWMCSYRVPFGFANGDVRLGVWRNDEGTSVTLEIDPAITRFTENYEQTRLPFISRLAKVADLIHSDYFVAGLHLPRVVLDRARFLSKQPGRYLASWRDGAFDESEVIQALGVKADAVRGLLPNFWFVSLFPLVPAD